MAFESINTAESRKRHQQETQLVLKTTNVTKKTNLITLKLKKRSTPLMKKNTGAVSLTSWTNVTQTVK